MFLRYQFGDVSTNLSKLLCYDAVPFWPIREQFGIQSFHSFSSITTSNATSEYGTVLELPSRNEEQSSGNKERTKHLGNKHFDVHFWRISPVRFPLKYGKDAACEGRKGWKNVYFHQSRHFLFVDIIKTIFRIFALTWRVSNYVFPPNKRYKLERRE